MISIFLIVIISFVLILLYSYISQDEQQGFVDDSPNTVGDISAVKEIKLTASRYEYSPSTINLKKGEKVKIIVENTDTVHGINIPELGVSDTTEIIITPDSTGTFEWFCNVHCGSGHGDMRGTIIVS